MMIGGCDSDFYRGEDVAPELIIEVRARAVAKELVASLSEYIRGVKPNFKVYFVRGNYVHDLQEAYFLEALGVDSEAVVMSDPQTAAPVHVYGTTVLVLSSNLDEQGQPYDATYEAVPISYLTDTDSLFASAG